MILFVFSSCKMLYEKNKNNGKSEVSNCRNVEIYLGANKSDFINIPLDIEEEVNISICNDSLFDFKELNFDKFKVVDDTIDFTFNNDENKIKGQLLIPKFPVQYYSSVFVVDSLKSIVKLTSFYIPHRIGKWDINGEMVMYEYNVVE